MSGSGDAMVNERNTAYALMGHTFSRQKGQYLKNTQNYHEKPPHTC